MTIASPMRFEHGSLFKSCNTIAIFRTVFKLWHSVELCMAYYMFMFMSMTLTLMQDHSG